MRRSVARSFNEGGRNLYAIGHIFCFDVVYWFVNSPPQAGNKNSSPPLEEYRQSRGGGQIIRFYVNHPGASHHPSIEGNLLHPGRGIKKFFS